MLKHGAATKVAKSIVGNVEHALNEKKLWLKQASLTPQNTKIKKCNLHMTLKIIVYKKILILNKSFPILN